MVLRPEVFGKTASETDETAMMAVTALALGVGFAVARDKVNGKERLKKRPRRRKDVRRRSTDVDATEMMNVEEPTAHNAGGMVLSDGGSTDKQSLHESLTSGRIWVSGALTSLMLICFALSGWLWTQSPRQNQTGAVAAELVQHRTVAVNETENIEDVRLGRRVVGRNPLREQTHSPSNIHPETHRTVRLEMNQHGTIFELAFLRSLTWLDEQQAQVGGMIHLVMTELGLDGPARVISIDPCPEIEADDGTGRMVVTGTMKHLAGNVLEIQTADDAEPLGVTDTHPIWSVDRQDFVVAGQLTVGESLEQADGTVTQITRTTPTRGPPVMVYNLEIDGEHVYRVGEDGLLVHNSCEAPDHHIVSEYDNLRRAEAAKAIKESRKILDGAKIPIGSKGLGKNVRSIPGHRGPHPIEYHKYVARSLKEAIKGLRRGSPEYKNAVQGALNALYYQIRSGDLRLF